MHSAIRVQTLDEAVCISQYIGKGVNTIILPTAMDRAD